MAESTSLSLNYLWEELLKVSIFLQRPAIQRQFISAVVTILLAWALSRWIWFQLRQRYPQLNVDENCEQRLEWRQYSLALIHYLTTPTLIWIAVGLVTVLFQQWGVQRGWFAGLFHKAHALLNLFRRQIGRVHLNLFRVGEIGAAQLLHLFGHRG